MRHLLWIVLVPALAAGNGKVWTVQHPDERLMRLSLVGGEIIGTAGDDVVFVVPATRVVSLQSFRTTDRPVARVLHGIGAPFHGMGGPVGLAVSALVHGGDKNVLKILWRDGNCVREAVFIAGRRSFRSLKPALEKATGIQIGRPYPGMNPQVFRMMPCAQ
jgi:hypothetical protein